MKRRTLRHGMLLAWLALSSTTAATPPERPTIERPTVEQSTSARHMGVASCASSLCHGSTKPLSVTAVQQNEYVTWSNFDPHARAYRVLLEPQSLRMAKRLGLRNAHEAPACLACHSDTTPQDQRGPRFQQSDGIGCESCHGASEQWLATHPRRPAPSHAANLAAGLVALEQPAIRAATCMGCHVGTRDRLATHRMMAAGHPRLAFELDTYTELWRTSGGREHFRRDADYMQRKSASSAFTTWLTGLAAASRSTIDMAAAHAGPGRRGMPEFAVFNCYSCHRAMRVDAWGPEESPGVTRLQDGQARALLAVAQAWREATAAAFARDLNALQTAASDDLAVLPQKAARAHRSLALLETALARRTGTRQELQQALDALVSAARRGAFRDYAAAEQAAMAMVLLLAELGEDSARRAQLEELFAALARDDAFDAQRFLRALEKLP